VEKVKRLPGSRGLFLDLDGTLADSLGVLRRVYFRFLEEFGLEGSDTEFDQLNGPKVTEIVRILRTRHQLPSEENELVLTYNRLIDDAYTKVLPLPGAMELLENAARRGWKLSLVTSNLRSRAENWIARNGFSSLLHSIVSGEEVGRGKPFPDLYALAISRSACVLTDSIAVEDSLHGAQAALAAGLRTFVIRSPIESAVVWPEKTEFIHRWKDLLDWV
jgi:HAD superfamily hydrolase (TIGR01509 family)